MLQNGMPAGYLKTMHMESCKETLSGSLSLTLLPLL